MIKYLRSSLEQEYNNLSLWYFVSFMVGIVIYFSLEFEPSFILVLTIFLFSLLLIFLRKRGIFYQFICGLTIALTFGILVSKIRVINLDGLAIKKELISKVSGQVDSIKPTIHGAQIVLSQVKIYKLSYAPQKIKLSIPKKYLSEIFINDKIQILAKLFRPQNSILPGGYDFGFYAYFADIGATGYAMSPPEILAHKEEWLSSIRLTIYNHLIENLGNIRGNFAAAILLGETKAINRQLMQDMRQSGISHVLCVSGLHLSLVAMILFLSIRFLLNLSNYIAYNYDVKRISAIFSLIGSFGYLELSGMQIAATRAFIMAGLFIYAIIIERSCFPMRSIAIAAFIILSLNPEYIFHPSFQLSFIAVLSLIAGYEFYLKNQSILGENKGIFGSIKFYVASNIYSSFLASIITAPVVINQFFIFSTYSIPNNLIVVPVMSFFLMPLALLSLPLMLLGIDKYIFKLMAFFIDIIIFCARYFNNLPGAVWYFGYITNLSIILFLFGFFWICIWKTKWRIWGLAIMAISFILMLYSPKPDLIFDANLNALGMKNKSGQLQIYANKIPEFNRTYWANWFGQKDSEVYPMNSRIISKKGGEVTIYYNDSQEITFLQNFLLSHPIILVFYDTVNCRVKTNENKRFNFK